jgi:hypothetical protein
LHQVSARKKSSPLHLGYSEIKSPNITRQEHDRAPKQHDRMSLKISSTLACLCMWLF